MFGFGWQTFATKGPDYLRQTDATRSPGPGSRCTTCSCPTSPSSVSSALLLWCLALFGAVGGAVLRRGPPELAPWRVGLVAVFVTFVVVANLGPVSYPFPNLLLWTWAGVAGSGFFLGSRTRPDVGRRDARRGCHDPRFRQHVTAPNWPR